VWQQPSHDQEWQIDNQSRTVASTAPEFVEIGREWAQPVLRVRGQLRIGSEPEEAAIAITDPTQHFLRRFQQILRDSGLQVKQTEISPLPLPSSAPEIAFVLSPPLSHLLVETNQNSNNLYAESLLRQLGQRFPTQPPSTSLTAGLAAMEHILSKLEVDPSGYALADGSGLSRQNLASPEAIVQVLQAMARSPQFETYRNSLAIAGESGTLRYRFVDTPVAGRLWGKTGALSGVAALSGYLYPANASPMVFSVLVNHFDQPVRTVRPLMDEIVLILIQSANCGASNSNRFGQEVLEKNEASSSR
jgi:D-alanyl-D-alanine carboxypeptidase/D-alanyl-D-alanine-endopeptidase (penicillin-binding protein 4)